MNNKLFYLFAVVLLAASGAFWFYMFQDSAEPQSQEVVTAGFDGEIKLTMYSNPGCDCCVKWADYLEEDGIEVETIMVDDPHNIKDEYNIPTELRSCHTGIVDGYVIEGHVHAEDIRRLLAERPDAIGLSAPGMPPNSPGMDLDVENEYQIVIFDKDENMFVYSVHN